MYIHYIYIIHIYIYICIYIYKYIHTYKYGFICFFVFLSVYILYLPKIIKDPMQWHHMDTSCFPLISSFMSETTINNKQLTVNTQQFKTAGIYVFGKIRKAFSKWNSKLFLANPLEISSLTGKWNLSYIPLIFLLKEAPNYHAKNTEKCR